MTLDDVNLLGDMYLGCTAWKVARLCKQSKETSKRDSLITYEAFKPLLGEYRTHIS